MSTIHTTNLLRLSKPLIILQVIALFHFQCKRADMKDAQETSKFSNCIVLVDSITTLLHNLDELEINNPNFTKQANQFNQDITEILQEVSSPDILANFTKTDKLDESLTLAIAQDTSIVIFSWDSRLGGSNPKIKSIALHTNNQKIESFSLDKLSVRCTDIYNLYRETKQPVYLFKGLGQSSGVDFYSSLHAFTVENGLKKTDIFPKNQSSITTDYTLGRPIDFIVSNDASKIFIPNKTYPYNDWGLTYSVLSFDGENYQQQTSQIDFPVNSDSFNGPKNYDNGYLEGSEIPIDTTQKENLTSFTLVFKDSIQIEHNYDPDEETTLLKIMKKNDKTPVVLPFKSYYARLLAKQKQYLFVRLSGTSNHSPLLVYDITKQEFIASISQAGIKLHDEAVLVAQPIEKNNIGEKPKCVANYGDQTAYFQTFILEYRSEYPTIMPTGQQFCGFSE